MFVSNGYKNGKIVRPGERVHVGDRRKKEMRIHAVEGWIFLDDMGREYMAPLAGGATFVGTNLVVESDRHTRKKPASTCINYRYYRNLRT